MTKFDNTLLLGWCEDIRCGNPIRGAAGQRCPKYCLPCAIKRTTGVKAPNDQAGEPNELILGGADYRTLRDSSDEDNQD